MEPRFIHLRLHTEYSLSDGLVQIDPLVDEAIKLGCLHSPLLTKVICLVSLNFIKPL